ncbi:hypothetical protein CORC01_07599 [Colletotrichum orchidophilum]|uniref:F-box domain-containing protein n=1 Tax=Colletotrichum orchidophilum TaxID=1209926 RepID=A0A1G4B6T3_9PEZI|nr:uncharacterized protein CORC01_07599 [Colletotrichum orchidophilum]OHE97158.1 hypothetical protein CORC01_07599 [Colletotrichum orchidophilum]
MIRSREQTNKPKHPDHRPLLEIKKHPDHSSLLETKDEPQKCSGAKKTLRDTYEQLSRPLPLRDTQSLSESYEEPSQPFPSDAEPCDQPSQPLDLGWLRRWIKAIAIRVIKEKEYQGPGLDHVLSPSLILVVAKHLTMVERAALSLTSKKMLLAIGEENFWLVSKSGGQLDLLALLERDASNSRDVLCRLCQKFHDPILSVTASDYDSQGRSASSARPCVKEIFSSRHQRMASPYLPRELHFNMIKAFMRSQRSQTGSYRSSLLESTAIYRHKKTEANIQQATTCRVLSQGDLLIKTVTTLFACRDANQAKNNVRFIVELLKRNKLTTCCEHVDWMKTYPFVFNYVGLPTDEDKLRKYHKSRLNDPMKKIRDIWNPAVVPRYSPRNFVWIMACEICYTNYTYEWKDTEEGSRIVMLISYKNLGKGEDVNDVKWSSHFKHNTPDPNTKPRDTHYVGFPRWPHGYTWHDKVDDSSWERD